MKILITGGCGFLGSNLAASHLDRGEEVVIADALFRQGTHANLEWLQSRATGTLHFHEMDIAEPALVDEIFEEHGPFDFICHVAGQVAMTTSLEDPRRDLMTNILGTFNVLEATRRFSPRALVAYSSTNKVYGDLEHLDYFETPTRYTLPAFPGGIPETLPLDFSTPYGCSKGSADQYVRDWSRVYGLSTVVFRHSSIYGGRQFASFDQGWIGWFCQKAIEQSNAAAEGRVIEPFTISGSGKQVRDVLHADDLVALYRAAYDHRDQASGQIFNIGGGTANSLSLLELLAILADKVGLDALQYEKLPRRQSDQDFFVAAVAKAKSLLDWSPRVTTNQGLDRMLDWARQLATEAEGA